MTDLTPWFLAVGTTLIVLALSATYLQRLPLSTSILGLLVGVALGPVGINLVSLDVIENSFLLEVITEIAVIISLFTAGLQLRLPLLNYQWRIAALLAVVSMAITVGLLAALGVFAMGFPLGTAIILGAVLAPTDPVLASDVQVQDPTDRDRLRFVLTAEAGLNDGTAFPFVMLGLGLVGAHELGRFGWYWWTVDVLWAVTAGLTIGALWGTVVGRLVIRLRQRGEAVGTDNFLAVGLIALSYGSALWAHSYGFLAVFAAGVALRRVERISRGPAPSEALRQAAATAKERSLAIAPDSAPAFMAEAVLNFNASLERFAEVLLVVLVGSMLNTAHFSFAVLAFVLASLFIVRPLAVYTCLVGVRMTSLERAFVAWFGIRGIGSLYYLSYAIEHGLRPEWAESIADLVLAAIAVSIVVHGISATPLMKYYSRKAR
jgi:sodium/hydrogen antiporter